MTGKPRKGRPKGKPLVKLTKREKNFLARFHEIAYKLAFGPAKIKDKKWICHFNLLLLLRIVNKFHRRLINEALFPYRDFLIQSCDSLRSNIMKKSLILILEIFQYST